MNWRTKDQRTAETDLEVPPKSANFCGGGASKGV